MINRYSFADLVFSAFNLIIRFGAKPTMEQAIVKINEEMAEFLAELRKPNPNTALIAQEMTDVIVTMVNAAGIEGVHVGDIEAAFATTIHKNDLKNHLTHYVEPDTQLIKRR